MAEEPTASGWLPPHAPGAKPPPRFAPAPEPSEPEPGPGPGAPPPDGDAAPGGWAPPAATPPAAAPPPATTPPGPQADRTGPPAFVASKPRGPAGSLAIVSLVLSACGLALLLLSLGLSFVFSLPLGAGGLIAAQRARTRHGGAEAGGGQVKVAFWLAIAATGLAVLALVVWLVLIVVFDFSLEDFRRDLERELERQREQQGGSDPRVQLEALRAAAHALLRPF